MAIACPASTFGASGNATGWATTGTGAGAGVPKPPRAQSTTLLAAILPQMSSPGGLGALPAIGVDQSDAGDVGGEGALHVDAAGSGAAPGRAPQPDDAGFSDVGAGEVETKGDIAPPSAAGGAPQPEDGGDGAAAGLGSVPGGAQFCDIGPLPEMAEAVGTASQPDALAGEAALPPPASHPFHAGGGGAAFR